jgi:hypothetical protein
MAANAKKLSSSILTLLASAGVKITMMTVSASAGARILMILLSQPADATMDISAFHMRGTMISATTASAQTMTMSSTPTVSVTASIMISTGMRIMKIANAEVNFSSILIVLATATAWAKMLMKTFLASAGVFGKTLLPMTMFVSATMMMLTPIPQFQIGNTQLGMSPATVERSYLAKAITTTGTMIDEPP